MNTTRNTPCGPITGCGCQWPGVAAYKGIRYATAGRWEYPTPVTRWEGTYQATAYGAACYQPRSFYDEAQVPEKAFYYNEFRRGEHYDYSEDCLFLNIWTPADAGPDARLPVLFYIHGGGFTGGCGHEKHFDGPAWPTKGVVAWGRWASPACPSFRPRPATPATTACTTSCAPCSGCMTTSRPLAATPTG